MPSSYSLTDDRLINQTLSHWIFGEDGTGNITSKTIISNLIECSNKMGRVDLVTADGSFDCQDEPEEQERITSNLHFCEVMSALTILSPKGSFVLKIFTVFEICTLNILYLLACVFEELHVYKPITSKLGNSEVYVIGLEYLGCDYFKEVYNKLMDIYGEYDISKVLFARNDIPESFMYEIIKCTNFFTESQIKAIKRNITTYGNFSDKEKQYIELMKHLVVDKFCDQNYCDNISKSLTLHKIEWDKHIKLDTKSGITKWGGHISKFSIEKRYSFLVDPFNFYSSSYVKGKVSDSVNSFNIYHEYMIDFQNFTFDIKLCKGKPFKIICVSRFCDLKVLQVYLNLFWENNCQICGASGSFYNHVKQCKILEKYDNVPESSDVKYLPLIENEDIPNFIKEKYPSAKCLTENNRPLLGNCESLEMLMSFLESGSLSPDDEIILWNVPLLSQLQNGLFTVISSLFRQVSIFTNNNDFTIHPFIYMKGLSDINSGIELVRLIKSFDWSNGGSLSGLLSIISLESLLQSPVHAAVCRYNIVYILHRIKSIISKS